MPLDNQVCGAINVRSQDRTRASHCLEARRKHYQLTPCIVSHHVLLATTEVHDRVEAGVAGLEPQPLKLRTNTDDTQPEAFGPPDEGQCAQQHVQALLAIQAPYEQQ